MAGGPFSVSVTTAWTRGWLPRSDAALRFWTTAGLGATPITWTTQYDLSQQRWGRRHACAARTGCVWLVWCKQESNSLGLQMITFTIHISLDHLPDESISCLFHKKKKKIRKWKMLFQCAAIYYTVASWKWEGATSTRSGWQCICYIKIYLWTHIGTQSM